MSLLFIDGFDHYQFSIDKYDAQTITGGSHHNVTDEGRFTPGAYHLLGAQGGLDAGNGTLTKSLTTTATEGIFGFALRYTDSVSNAAFRFRNTAGSKIGGISLGGANIKAIDSDDNIVGTATGALTVAVWQYVEVRVKSHATAGEIEIHVNGTQVLSLSALDTRGSALGQWHITRGAEADDAWIDDLYILDNLGSAPQNTFIGDVRVTSLSPKANGNDNNFTPTGASNNFEAVDETIHDSDTTFVEAGQIGAKEDYNNKDFADIGVAPSTIFAVQTVNAAKKTDAGQLKYKDTMVIAGSSFDDGTEVTASSGVYKMTTFVRDTDPSDSAAWTEAKVAATGSGFEITFREV